LEPINDIFLPQYSNPLTRNSSAVIAGSAIFISIRIKRNKVKTFYCQSIYVEGTGIVDGPTSWVSVLG